MTQPAHAMMLKIEPPSHTAFHTSRRTTSARVPSARLLRESASHDVPENSRACRPQLLLRHILGCRLYVLPELPGACLLKLPLRDILGNGLDVFGTHASETGMCEERGSTETDASACAPQHLHLCQEAALLGRGVEARLAGPPLCWLLTAMREEGL